MGQVASHVFGGAAVNDEIGFIHNNFGDIWFGGVKASAFSLVIACGDGSGFGHICMVNLVFHCVGSVFVRGFDGDVGLILLLVRSFLVGLHFVDDAEAVNGRSCFAVSKAMAFGVATVTNHFFVVGSFSLQSTSFGHFVLLGRLGWL
jgi:hypothetical protein